jgi:hypothetical protein
MCPFLFAQAQKKYMKICARYWSFIASKDVRGLQNWLGPRFTSNVLSESTHLEQDEKLCCNFWNSSQQHFSMINDGQMSSRDTQPLVGYCIGPGSGGWKKGTNQDQPYYEANHCIQTLDIYVCAQASRDFLKVQ